MKIGILSDSHDNLANIQKTVRVFREAGVEVIVHAGDFCSPFFFREAADYKDFCSRMYAVFGNNDGDKVMLKELGLGFCEFREAVFRFDLEGRKVVVMHYPDVAESLYRSGDFDLVIFGHTHRLVLEGKDRLLLNPGTCSGYLAPDGKATVAVFNTLDMGIDILNL